MCDFKAFIKKVCAITAELSSNTVSVFISTSIRVNLMKSVKKMQKCMQMKLEYSVSGRCCVMGFLEGRMKTSSQTSDELYQTLYYLNECKNIYLNNLIKTQQQKKMILTTHI